MVFRPRFRRRFVRRRRRGPETYTHVQCAFPIEAFVTSTCSNPIVDGILLLGPDLESGLSDPGTAPGIVDIKTRTFKGMKFEAVFHANPADAQETIDPPPDPVPSAVTFNVRFWEAVVLLPLDHGSKTTPAYIPQFTINKDSRDLADRVLWKRITTIPWWGLLSTGGVPQLTGNMRDTNGGQQVIKSRCRVDDRHALFYFFAMVHNLFLPDPQPGGSSGSIPFTLEFWAKMYYSTALGGK